MKVAVYHNNSDIRIEERPIPSIGKGELLVQVKASGICGTDLMEWYRVKSAPRVLGHEMTGVIVKSASSVFRPGLRVFVSHHVPCHECKHCQRGHHTACETLHKGNYDPGGFSEYVRVPAVNVKYGAYILPESVSFDEGTLTEPLGCVIRAQQLMNIQKGHDVLVMGAGFSGLLNIWMAKKRGARVWVSEIDPYRMRLARQFGADEVFFADEMDDVKADRILMCTGAEEAFKKAFRCIDRKGIILYFAIPDKDISIPIIAFWRNELSIVSSYGAAPTDLKKALYLIEQKALPVSKLLTHHIPLTHIRDGFSLAASGKQVIKVIIHPDEMN